MAARKYTKKHHKGKRHQKRTRRGGGNNNNGSYSNKYNTITANNANEINFNNSNLNGNNLSFNINNNIPKNNIYTAQEIMDQLQRHIKLYGKNTPIRTEKDGISGQVYGVSYDDENKAITIEI